MKRILFFDGVCHLCNGLVNFSLPKFAPGKMFYAPLQGQTAKDSLPAHDLGLDYVVYLRDGIIYRKSQAIIHLLIDMGGFYTYIGIMLRILPTGFRDFVYTGIAKYRYKIFGKDEVCRLPTAVERPFFLD